MHCLVAQSATERAQNAQLSPCLRERETGLHRAMFVKAKEHTLVDVNLPVSWLVATKAKVRAFMCRYILACGMSLVLCPGLKVSNKKQATITTQSPPRRHHLPRCRVEPTSLAKLYYQTCRKPRKHTPPPLLYMNRFENGPQHQSAHEGRSTLRQALMRTQQRAKNERWQGGLCRGKLWGPACARRAQSGLDYNTQNTKEERWKG